MHACMRTCMHACVHTHIHTKTHAAPSIDGRNKNINNREKCNNKIESGQNVENEGGTYGHCLERRVGDFAPRHVYSTLERPRNPSNIPWRVLESVERVQAQSHLRVSRAVWDKVKKSSASRQSLTERWSSASTRCRLGSCNTPATRIGRVSTDAAPWARSCCSPVTVAGALRWAATCRRAGNARAPDPAYSERTVPQIRGVSLMVRSASKTRQDTFTPCWGPLAPHALVDTQGRMVHIAARVKQHGHEVRDLVGGRRLLPRSVRLLSARQGREFVAPFSLNRVRAN
jgi:hypothetical protein